MIRLVDVIDINVTPYTTVVVDNLYAGFMTLKFCDVEGNKIEIIIVSTGGGSHDLIIHQKIDTDLTRSFTAAD